MSRPIGRNGVVVDARFSATERIGAYCGPKHRDRSRWEDSGERRRVAGVVVEVADYDFTVEQMAALWRAGVTVDDVCRYHATDDCAWHSAEEAFRTLMDRRAEA